MTDRTPAGPRSAWTRRPDLLSGRLGPRARVLARRLTKIGLKLREQSVRSAVLWVLALPALITCVALSPPLAAVSGGQRSLGRDVRVVGEEQRSTIAGENATFVSSNLGIAFAYPRDWTAAEESSGVRLTGPNGGALLVERLDDATAGESETDLPNTHCGSQTNGYGIVIHTCFDTISRSVSAWFEVGTPVGRVNFRVLTRQATGRRVLATVTESMRSLLS